MPFKGFLGPSWELAVLTRILRRLVHFNTTYMNIQAVMQKF